MCGTVCKAIKTRLIPCAENANNHEGTIASFAGVVNHLLRSYIIDTVIAKAKEKLGNCKQGLLTPCNAGQDLWDLSLSCSGVYNELALKAFSAESNDFSIRNVMRRL